MRIFFLAAALGALVSTFTGACAARAPTMPPPTLTPIVYPSTWTPVTTPPPPTATATASPTSTPDLQTLQVFNALERTRKLTVYFARLEMTLIDPTGAVPGAQPHEPYSLMRMEGRQNQDDSQWRLSGFFILMIGGDANKGIEFVSHGDKMYLHGPLPFFGAPEDRWYVAPKAASGNLTVYLGPNSFLNEFSRKRARFPQMRAIVHETLDNRACTKYQGDERETMELFAVLDENGQFTQRVGALDGVVQDAVFRVWVCEDGYVHQLEMGIQATDKQNPAQVASLEISLRMSDMNVLVPLTTPTEAIPLSAPLVFPTPINANP